MIARVWTARTTSAQSESYLHHFEQAVQPELRRIEGFLGAAVGTRPSPGSMEILVTTYWESRAAIDAFGADREDAVVAAEASALLTDFDKRVRHYQVALAKFPADR